MHYAGSWIPAQLRSVPTKTKLLQSPLSDRVSGGSVNREPRRAWCDNVIAQLVRLGVGKLLRVHQRHAVERLTS